MTAHGEISGGVSQNVREAADAIADVLEIGTPEAFATMITILRARLRHNERAGIALAALRSLPADSAGRIAERFEAEAGRPSPVFVDALSEARSWAQLAGSSEIRAYALACFERMPPERQKSFMAYVTDKRAQAP